MVPHALDHRGAGGHHHAESARDAGARRLAVALGLILAFMAGEVVVGILAGSLALLSDAAHMLTDAGALGLAIVAMRLAARPVRGGGFTYGLKRVEILSALANGVTMVLLGGLIVAEAVHRLISPFDVGGRAVLAVALAGIAFNLVATWQVAGADRRSINVEGGFQHILTDLYAFIATAVAGAVILTTGFDRADPIASLFTAALMLRAAWGLIVPTGRALMEASPGGLRPDDIGNALAAHPHVANVHDLHVWEITSGFPALSAHVIVHPGDDCHAIRLELERFLDERFGIEHTTLQVDHESDNRVTWTGRPLPPAPGPEVRPGPVRGSRP